MLQTGMLRTRCLLIGAFLASPVAIGAAVGTTPANPTAAQILAQLAPLPESVPRTIRNPYYADPAWKLWAVDPSPVTLKRPPLEGTFRPPRGGRRYPVLGLKRGVPTVLFEPLGDSGRAGSWDDVYLSLDGHHTHLSEPRGAFLDAGALRTARDVQAILDLGVNFTSQSYADRGRALVDDTFNTLNIERHFFFANCVRATPCHLSYQDVGEDMATDHYDGLCAHVFNSLGQSGSELHALYKMMLAGAALPRATKDLLKRHGAYGIALLTLFKATLPYADAAGRPLPYAHELRHRPVYSARGRPWHPHYCLANAVYHGYDETEHLRALLDRAGAMTVAPPVALLQLTGMAVQRAGGVITDPALLRPRIKCLSVTQARVWGQPGDTLILRIDLRRSYDLQDRPLSYHCRALYPGQRNVAVHAESPGVFRLRLRHDPKLPKGRIPIMAWVENGGAVPSNPVFVNGYWPDPNELDDYLPTHGLSEDIRREMAASGLKRLPVNVNRRPVCDFNVPGDALRCRPGQRVAVALRAEDPEGYPVTFYRWAGEPGTLAEGRWTFTVPADARPGIRRLHFLASDGTGAVTGRVLKLLVDRTGATGPLPAGWALSVLGPADRAASVQATDARVRFGRLPRDPGLEPMQGTFVFRPVGEQVDLSARLVDVGGGADLGLMLTNTLDGFSPRIAVGSFQGRLEARRFGGSGRQAIRPIERRDRPALVRLVRQGGAVAVYVSADGRSWEQILTAWRRLYRHCFAGLICRPDPWKVSMAQWLTPPGTPLPRFDAGRAEPDADGRHQAPLEVTVRAADPNAVLHVTVDGSEPTAASPRVAGPLRLTGSGRHEIRVRDLRDGPDAVTTRVVYTLK